MDLIDREQLMNYIRSRKINIGKLAHDVIMKQPSIQPQEPFNIDTYCKEHFCVMVDKDLWEKAEKALKQEPKIGHWKYIQYDKPQIGNWHCSECGRIVFLLKSQKSSENPLYDYCPWCGAKMESESDV